MIESGSEKPFKGNRGARPGGGFKTIAKVFAGFGASSVFGTITQVIRAKLGALLLGVSGVGVLNQLTAFASLAQVISSLGFNVGIVRSVAKGIEDDDESAIEGQISSAGLAMLATSALACGLIAFNASWLSNWLFADEGARFNLVILIGLSVPFLTLANVYKSMLSGARSVRGLIRAQVVSDLLSVGLFAVLVYPFGLFGATLSYVGSQLVLLIFRARATFAALGKKGLVPRFAHFRWHEVSDNLVYGVNGLATAGAATMATLLVSRHVIVTMSEAENGLFTTAAKVGTLFLGGVYALANSYTLPAFVAARADAETSSLLSQTLKLYLFALPPVVLGLMAFGEPIVSLLFASSFSFAGIVLVPLLVADLFRVLTETIGLTLVAQRKLAVVTAAYLGYVILLVALVYGEVLGRGLLAIGFSYIVAQAAHLAVMSTLARTILGVRPSRSTILIFGVTCAYVGLMGFFTIRSEYESLRPVMMIICGSGWLAVCLLDRDCRLVVEALWRRIRAPFRFRRAG